MRYLGSQTNAEVVVDCRTAVLNALNEIWGKHEWPWYQNQCVMQINGPYSTGTVTYTAATRRFTLTGGTWPSWSNYACMRIGTKDARVTKIISSTVIEIEDGTPFLDDIAVATNYNLYRNEYPVPNNIRKMSYVFLEENAYAPLQYMPPLEFRTKMPGSFGAVPLYYTIQRDRNPLGGLNIVFWPYPTRNFTARFAYVREANEVAYWDENTGKVAVTASGTTVTGTGTAFEAGHASTPSSNVIIRIGRDPVNVPTNRHGQYPFSDETLVTTYTSATSLEVSPVFAYSRSNVKYSISSLLDIDEKLMSSMFTLQCYFELGKIRHLADRDVEEIKKMLDLATKDAKSRSNPVQEISYAGTFSNLRRYAGVWFNIGV